MLNNAPLAAGGEEHFENLTTKMVHSEVYLNKYVVSIAPFSTRRVESSFTLVRQIPPPPFFPLEVGPLKYS